MEHFLFWFFSGLVWFGFFCLFVFKLDVFRICIFLTCIGESLHSLHRFLCLLLFCA